MSSYYYLDERFNTLEFLTLPDDELLTFIRSNSFSPNAEWAPGNPALHFFLANEMYSDIRRLFNLIHERINPNLCDGDYFGKKSLLILFSLLPNTDDLMLHFIDLFHEKLNFDYQDSNGRTALHYAIILGRVKVVNRLIELGASLNIYDNHGHTAFDYLNCSHKIICSTLKMIDIEPSRDTRAPSNTLSDHDGHPLMLQGTYLTQRKDVIDRVRKSEPVLIKYIKGHPAKWSTFIGDNTSATFDELLKLAKSIANNKRKSLSTIFVNEVLPKKDQITFAEYLEHLSKSYSGKSILEKCMEGHALLTQQLTNFNEKQESFSMTF